jgi:hypothetical protein
MKLVVVPGTRKLITTKECWKVHPSSGRVSGRLVTFDDWKGDRQIMRVGEVQGARFKVLGSRFRGCDTG